MNKNVLIISFCVLTTILICFILYKQNNRYYMQIAGNGLVYKIDKKTGQMWQISGGKERLIVPQELQESVVTSKTTDLAALKEQININSAITLAKQSYLLNQYRWTEDIINKIMAQKKGDIKIVGWQAKKVSDGVYLVSYTYDDGKSETGWYFEVQIGPKIVRDVWKDQELKIKYGLVK